MTKMKKTEDQRDRIPTFANEREVAAFWDSHSPLDYPDDFEEVDIKLDRPARGRGLRVTLDQATLDQLTDVAKAQGIGPSTLASILIVEHLKSHPPRAT